MALTPFTDVQTELTTYQNDLIARTNANIATLTSRLSQTANPVEQSRLSALIATQNSYLSGLTGGSIVSQANQVHATLVQLESTPNVDSPSPNYEAGSTNMMGDIWYAANLSVTEYANGDPIPYISNDAEWASTTGGAWCYYDNDPANAEYGFLYNYYAVIDPRGLAPEGWRVSTVADWAALAGKYGGTALAGGAIKEKGTTHWNVEGTGTTNESGLTVLPGGYRKGSGDAFDQLGVGAFIWADNGAKSKAKAIPMSFPQINEFSDADGDLHPNTSKYGCSVRIVKI